MLRWAKIRILPTRKTIYKKGSLLEKAISFLSILLPSGLRKALRYKAEKEIRAHNRLKDGFDYFFAASPNMIKRTFPSNIFDKFVLMPYEKSNYYAATEYDLMLRIPYGDYMKLPPKEDRICKHNPEILEFKY